MEVLLRKKGFKLIIQWYLTYTSNIFTITHINLTIHLSDQRSGSVLIKSWYWFHLSLTFKMNIAGFYFINSSEE